MLDLVEIFLTGFFLIFLSTRRFSLIREENRKSALDLLSRNIGACAVELLAEGIFDLDSREQGENE